MGRVEVQRSLTPYFSITLNLAAYMAAHLAMNGTRGSIKT